MYDGGPGTFVPGPPSFPKTIRWIWPRSRPERRNPENPTATRQRLPSGNSFHANTRHLRRTERRPYPGKASVTGVRDQ